MRANRRSFLRLGGHVLALLLGGPTLARARECALEIHRSTRNTLVVAIGSRLRSLRGTLLRYKPYQGAQRVTLPPFARKPSLPLVGAAQRYAPAAGFAPERISLAELARLLHFTNGVTGQLGGIQLRAAPSAGALYAGEVYVVAHRVRGLTPGVYYFAPLDAELVRIRDGAWLHEAAQALEEPSRIENAAAVVLLTNVFRRYRSRYANRGYRYALIDSGHIGENLRLAALSAGCADWSPLRFHDDRLNRLLEVDGREEAVCALHAVGRPATGPAGGWPRTVALREKQVVGEPPSDVICDEPERYHEASMLVPADGSPAPEPQRSDPDRETPRPTAPPLPMRSPPPEASVERSIEQRRSALRLRATPIALGDLGQLLETACGNPALRRAPGVELQLAVHRVTGVQKGLYRYAPRTPRLVSLREGDVSDALVRACLGQEKAGEAAVAFLMVAHLGEATARGGDRSYRDLLIESGAIGQRIYLAAEALRLAARNLAAFADDELNELAGLDGRSRAVIHLTVLGVGD